MKVHLCYNRFVFEIYTVPLKSVFIKEFPPKILSSKNFPSLMIIIRTIINDKLLHASNDNTAKNKYIRLISEGSCDTRLE